jgi:hypothetical protein
MKNKLLLFVLTISIIATMNLKSIPVEPLDPDGDGYRNVESLDNLQWISETGSTSLNYKLYNDIDATLTNTWNPDNGVNLGFLGIGDSTNHFTGIFDGNNHTISNLYMNSSQDHYTAMFRVVNGQIKNLTLSYCSITGHGQVGALVGTTCYGSVITNCSSSGMVSGYYLVGGLIGNG